MTREEKGQIIEELSAKFAENNHFYITDATGFTVEQINNFRRLCYKSGVEYRVYKNTLIQKALERNKEVDYSPMFKALKGFSGVIFSSVISSILFLLDVQKSFVFIALKADFLCIHSDMQKATESEKGRERERERRKTV